MKNNISFLQAISRVMRHGFSIVTWGWCMLFFLPQPVAAQETVVVGQVLNGSDKSPVSSVNIYFKNTTIGVQSNEEGYFIIRSMGDYNTLVFSAIGYQRKEIRVKPWKSVGIQVELSEESTVLQELFVLPGVNPAIGMMKKVRWFKKANDLSSRPDYTAISTEQQLVLLHKLTQRTISKRLFEQLRKSSLNEYDSAVVVPLYMSENKYRHTHAERKLISKNLFNSPPQSELLIEKFMGEMETDLNFYNNSIIVFGKSLVSPLSNVGNAYYNYFLADSVMRETDKQYIIHFRTKNPKNLAFNGRMWIDSASYALTAIEAALPSKANINFIRNLHISQKFRPLGNNAWTRQSEEMALNMQYALLADSLQPMPEIFIKRSATFELTDTLVTEEEGFARSEYRESALNVKIGGLYDPALLRTARWIADIALTGYIPVGKIDIGKIQQIIRITDIEGFRLTLPFKTNEKLWKNVSLGGYAGYGFGGREVKYSALAQFRIPGIKKRILSFDYTNDYRRVNYNYNDFLYRENPLVTGDIDISNTVFSLASAGNMSERHEWSAAFTNEWNADVESSIYLRHNRLFTNPSMPMQLGGTAINGTLQQQSATLSTRFSFGERTYDDHMQRLYFENKKPVIYSIMELGRFHLNSGSGLYGKLIGKMRHTVNMDFAQLYYIAEAGLILGDVPYPLLESPVNGGSYSLNHFSMMRFREYAADKYINVHSEMIFNGIILNRIPLIKHLNLREMTSVNLSYGSLKDGHKALLDYPANMYPLSKPYVEVGVGFSNILHLFTLQSVWRLTDLNHPGTVRWGLRGSVRVSF